MSIQQKPGHIDEKITAKDVELYLRRHPDFFEQNPMILTELSVPHLSGGAVSLIERQVGVLRKQNTKLSRQLEELVKIARENDMLGRQVFRLMLALMGSKKLGQVFALLQETLKRDFSADAVAIRLMATPKQSGDLDRDEFAIKSGLFMRTFDKYLKDGRPVCGRFKQQHKQILFGDNAEGIKSVAFIPLAVEKSFGVLAIGSNDEKRFQAGMGTLYLTQMSELISKTLLEYVDPLA